MPRQRRIPNVHFNLKNKTNPDKESLIVMVMRYNNQRMVYSTGEKVFPAYWDDGKQRAKTTNKYPEYSDMNSRLSEVEEVAKEIFKEFDYGDISQKKFKEEIAYRTKRMKRPSEEHPSFLEFVDQYLEQRKTNKNTKLSTWKVLQKVANHLKNYAAEKDLSLDYDAIDWDFRNDFENWLYSPPREHSTNYAAKIITVVSQFLNESYERGYHNNLIHKKRGWHVKKEKTRKAVLSFDELQILYNLDLSENDRLEKVRDAFLIGAYSGLRFSDFTRITPEHIISEEGVEMIEIFTQKTDTEVAIPLMPQLKAILEKYNYYSPPVISNQKMNQYLKELCQLAGIDETIKVKTSIGGKRVELEKPKYELITTHTARRSFATNFYELGIPAIHLMQITGHATERQFMDYINISKRRNAKELAKRFKLLMNQTNLRIVK